MDLQEIVQKRKQAIDDRPTKSRISTRHQVEAVEVWENMLNKKIALPVLLRLAKLNLSVFLTAKNALHAIDKDGMEVKNRVSYFLWLYKHHNKKI